MRSTDHIVGEELLEYAEGQAEARLAERVRVHLATGCPVCNQELAAWTRIVGCLQADQKGDVPEWVRQRAFAIMEPTPAAIPLLERIMAVLVGDSRLRALPSLARTVAEPTPALELLYEAGGIHVGLLCRYVQDAWQIAGQLLPAPSDASLPAPMQETTWKVVADSAAGQQTTDADEWNEFHLPELRPGTYALTLRSPRTEIVLPELELPD